MRRHIDNRCNEQVGDAGFTLLELLVALTLLALLMPLAFGGFRQATAMWWQIDARAVHGEQIQASQVFLRRQLAQAYPAYRSAQPVSAVDFVGTAESLQFMAPLPEALGAGLTGRFVLRTEMHEGRRNLVIEWRREFSRPRPTEELVVLLEEIDSLEIGYYGAVGTGPARWSEGWQGQPSLPQLVRVRVNFPAADRRRWPELVVAPRIAVDAKCAFDPLTLGCRGR